MTRTLMSLACVLFATACAEQPYAPEPAVPRGGPPVDPSHVLVTTAPTIPGPLDLIEVLDFHTKATSEDKGFDELKRKAASLGADAVIHAEFEHGDGDEPSHLSGMAVRVGRPLPAYQVISRVEVDTDEDAEDKGLPELQRKAAAVGADEIIGIEFEHGEGKQPSRLSGLAVRLR